MQRMYVLIYSFFLVTTAGLAVSTAVSTATAEFSSREKCNAAGQALVSVMHPTAVKPTLKELEGWNMAVAKSEETKDGSTDGSEAKVGAILKWRCFPK